MKEVWKDIVNYVGKYKVSNLGKVNSIAREVYNGHHVRVVPELVLKQSHTNDGYSQVIMSNGWKTKQAYVHRLVAQAFIPNPENKPEVHHINHVRDDNSVENLEWVTREQQRDDHWKKKKGKSIFIDDIEYNSYSDAAKSIGVSQSAVGSAIKNNRTTIKGHSIKQKKVFKKH